MRFFVSIKVAMFPRDVLFLGFQAIPGPQKVGSSMCLWELFIVVSGDCQAPQGVP